MIRVEDQELAIAIAKLKTDVVRQVLFDVSKASGGAEDAELVTELANRIDQAVAKALAAPLAAQQATLVEIREALKARNAAAESEAELNGLRAEVQRLRAEVRNPAAAELLAANGEPGKTSVWLEDARPADAGGGGILERGWRRSRYGDDDAARPFWRSGMFVALIGVVILLLSGYAGSWISGRGQDVARPSAGQLAQLQQAIDNSRNQLLSLRSSVAFRDLSSGANPAPVLDPAARDAFVRSAERVKASLEDVGVKAAQPELRGAVRPVPPDDLAAFDAFIERVRGDVAGVSAAADAESGANETATQPLEPAKLVERLLIGVENTRRELTAILQERAE